MRFISSLMIMLMLSSCAHVENDDPSHADVAIVKKGHTVPFDGVLYSNLAYAQTTAQASSALEHEKLGGRFKLDIMRLRMQTLNATMSISLSSLKREMEGRLKVKDDQIASLYKDLDDARADDVGLIRDITFFGLGMLAVVIGAWGIDKVGRN